MSKAPRWRVNDGTRPDTAGRRVVVELENGNVCGVEPVTKDSKPGWAVETTIWKKRPDWPFNVARFYIL